MRKKRIDPISEAITLLLEVIAKPSTYNLDVGQAALIEQAIDKLEQVEGELNETLSASP